MPYINVARYLLGDVTLEAERLNKQRKTTCSFCKVDHHNWLKIFDVLDFSVFKRFVVLLSVRICKCIMGIGTNFVLE